MSRVLPAVIGAFVLACAGCVTRAAYDAKVNQLTDELQVAQARTAGVSAQFATLEQENGVLKKEADAAKESLKKAQADAARATQQLDEMAKKYQMFDAGLVKDLGDVPGVTVDKKGAIRITGLVFELGGAELKGESNAVIQKIADALIKRNGLILVDGHTDNVPVEKPETKKLYVDNLGLSLARAAAVARALIDDKVPADRVIVRGFGSTRPIESGETAENRAKNRRVEIRLIPAESEEPPAK